MEGRIHSFESMGAVDGPGLRFVVFLQGCVLRCKYCHNPDSWDMTKGQNMSVMTCVNEILKYKNYFSNNGGVTVSGGEPLCQIDFVIELFKELKKHNIHTCLDTSGVLFDKSNSVIMKKFDELISLTDLVLLDIKHIDNAEHIELTGKPNENVLNFANYLSINNKPMWIRYVLVPNINTDEATLKRTKNFIGTLKTVEKVEVLPYHTMGIEKYRKLNIPYRLENTPPPTKEQIKLAESILHVHNTTTD